MTGYVVANSGTLSTAARHFGKSNAWIRPALKFFNELHVSKPESESDEPSTETEAA